MSSELPSLWIWSNEGFYLYSGVTNIQFSDEMLGSLPKSIGNCSSCVSQVYILFLNGVVFPNDSKPPHFTLDLPANANVLYCSQLIAMHISLLKSGALSLLVPSAFLDISSTPWVDLTLSGITSTSKHPHFTRTRQIHCMNYSKDRANM